MREKNVTVWLSYDLILASFQHSQFLFKPGFGFVKFTLNFQILNYLTIQNLERRTNCLQNFNFFLTIYAPRNAINPEQ